MGRNRDGFHGVAVCMVRIALSLALLGAWGCGGGGGSGDDKSGASSPIVTGPAAEAARATVGPEGGTLSVTDPTDPLRGLTLTVPAGAFDVPTEITVSRSAILGHTLGALFQPATPLIHVAAGETPAREAIRLRLPVAAAAGKFAMAFFYRSDGGRLEAMPAAAVDEGSLTVATRHFSDVVVTLADIALLLSAEASSPFTPGVDDWPMANSGTYASMEGQCGGQSLSALYYYTERAQEGEAPLYGRYDNNGDRAHPTPNLIKDDADAWRLIATVQNKVDVTAGPALEWLGRKGASDDLYTYLMFSYALRLTGEPQLALIYRDRGTLQEEGHAVVVYAKSGLLSRDGKSVAELSVADPNYPYTAFPPGSWDRRMVFDLETQKFVPYSSGPSTSDLGRLYPDVYFLGRTALVPWEELGRRWKQLDEGTVGDDVFPTYRLEVTDGSLGKWTTVAADYLAHSGELGVRVVTGGAFVPRLARYDVEGAELSSAEGNAQALPVLLPSPGKYRIGLLVEGQKDGKWGYVDFRWVTVDYQAAEPPGPTGLVLVGTLPLDHPARSVHVEAGIALVALDGSEPGAWTDVRVVDVTNRAAPAVLGRIGISTQSSAPGVARFLGQAVVGTGSIRLLGGADSASPRLVDSAGLNADCGNVAMVSGFAYVACGTYTYDTRRGVLAVFDPVESAEPLGNERVLGVLETDAGAVHDVALPPEGEIVYAATRRGNALVVDVTDPTAPKELARITDAGTAIAVEGNYLYGAGPDFAVFDVTAPASPVERSRSLGGDGSAGLVVSSGRAYTGRTGLDGGFVTVRDVSTPTRPVELGTIAVSGSPQALWVSEPYLYVALRNGDNTGALAIYSINR